MKHRQSLSLYGLSFAGSIALHGAVVALFFLPDFAPAHRPLVFQVVDVVEDRQKIEQHAEQTKAETSQPNPTATPEAQDETPQKEDTPPAPEQPVAKLPEVHPTAPDSHGIPMPAPPQRKPKPGTVQDNAGAAKQQQQAQSVQATPETEQERLRNYVRALTKKVQNNLIYPDEARQAGLHGLAKVSITILPSGDIDPASLKIVSSTGFPLLDASALNTVRSCLPFDPPPQQPMVLSIYLNFHT